MNYRIPVLFTGGTIGSCEIDGSLSTGGKAVNRKLLRLFEQSGSPYAGQVDFVEESPLETLSENMTLPRWNTLIDYLKNADWSDCDGVIITHGTDTLAYTACLLSLLLAGLQLPVVLVSSNYVLDDARANGRYNFQGAVEYICGGGTPGVYVSYRNGEGPIHLYKGALLHQCPPYSDRFTSASPLPYGEVVGGVFRPLMQEKLRPKAEEGEMRQDLLLHRVPHLTEAVLPIEPVVGLRYDRYNLDGVKAVVHGLYHSCTACVDRADPTGEVGPRSLLWLVKACKERGIPLYLATFRSALLEEAEPAYSTTGDLLAQGALPLCDMTWEMSYVKLLLAVHLYDDPAQRFSFLASDICGEHFSA